MKSKSKRRARFVKAIKNRAGNGIGISIRDSSAWLDKKGMRGGQI
jgi:hypothetical protein